MKEQSLPDGNSEKSSQPKTEFDFANGMEFCLGCRLAILAPDLLYLDDTPYHRECVLKTDKYKDSKALCLNCESYLSSTWIVKFRGYSCKACGHFGLHFLREENGSLEE